MGFPLETIRWARETKKQIKAAAFQIKNEDKKTGATEKPYKTNPEEKRKILGKNELSSEEKHKRLEDLFKTPENQIYISDEIFGDKRLISETIYKKLGHKYGFTEALRSGNFFPFPNELTQTTCATQMVINYVIAKECDLKPVIKEVIGFRREGSRHIGIHAFIEVDVGDEKPWVICQNWDLLGPVRWDNYGKTITVENVLERENEVFEYTIVDTFSEEEYLERIKSYRSEGAISVLFNGQRIGIPSTDKWKTEKPLETVWFLKYDPGTNQIISRVALQRPLVQNKGLESVISLDEEGNIISHEINGYFFREDSWAEFVNSTLMLSLPIETAESLSKGIEEFSVDKQSLLEESISDIFLDGPCFDSDYNYEKAIKGSYERVRQSPQFKSAWKFILTEALYQHARKESGKDFLYSEDERMYILELSQKDDSDVKNFVINKKNLELLRKAKKRSEKKGKNIHVISPGRQEYDSVKRFLKIRSSREMMIYQLENNARFCDEAADRLCHVRNVVKPFADTLASLEIGAKELLGSNFEKRTMAAYARIFTELLGMASFNWKQLKLDEYKEVLLDKIKKYKLQKVA